jgi:hypothetical protein
MAFHKSKLGSFGDRLPADINGYVPTADTGPWQLHFDHGSDTTHNADGTLTEYGKWWQDDLFPRIKTAAIKATAAVEARIRECQKS